ncbi:hypothetical protein M8J76_011703 [Diaphorina citri]|nr:hypothetical protein M8J76_011703 [Diaphorina citri]
MQSAASTQKFFLQSSWLTLTLQSPIHFPQQTFQFHDFSGFAATPPTPGKLKKKRKKKKKKKKKKKEEEEEEEEEKKKTTTTTTKKKKKRRNTDSVAANTL